MDGERGPEPLTTLHREILRRAHASVRAVVGDLALGSRGRAADRIAWGLPALRLGLESASVSSQTFEELLVLARTDARLAFVDEVPQAGVVGASLARALTVALHGEPDPIAAQSGALFGAFNTLLDGLIDEAPALLRSDLPAILSLSSADVIAREALPRPISPDSHPLVRATYAIGAACSRRVASADPTLRVALLELAPAALAAETESAVVQTFAATRDLAHVDRILKEKSSATLAAHALAAVGTRPLPTGIRPGTIRSAMEQVGSLGGWLDDLSDMSGDLVARRWNRAWLEIRPTKTPDEPFEIEATLRGQLAQPSCVERLISRTVDQLDDAFASLANAKLDHPETRSLIADVALAATGGH